VKGAATQYGARLAQYKRRESMTVWVFAGIAGLLAIVGSDALEGRPELFPRLLLTIVVLGGISFAYARVNFEWAATTLQRAIQANSALENAALVGDHGQWPSLAELCWKGLRVWIVVGWATVLIGVWWPKEPEPIEAADRIETLRQSLESGFHSLDARLLELGTRIPSASDPSRQDCEREVSEGGEAHGTSSR
jgi:hypothetical protein